MAYAKQADLIAFLGNTPVPAEADRLLARASEFIQRATLNNGNGETDQEVVDALRDATCAQVELWVYTGEAHSILAPTGNMSIGGTSYQAAQQLAPRARTLLTNAGLMYRGVRLR